MNNALAPQKSKPTSVRGDTRESFLPALYSALVVRIDKVLPTQGTPTSEPEVGFVHPASD